MGRRVMLTWIDAPALPLHLGDPGPSLKSLITVVNPQDQCDSAMSPTKRVFNYFCSPASPAL